MSAADVAAAVGQLGDNSLAAASLDLSGLRLEQGGHTRFSVAVRMLTLLAVAAACL